MSRVSAVGVSSAQVDAMDDRLRELALRSVNEIAAKPPESSRLPLSSAHQQMYEVAAEAEHASGVPALLAWATNPWAPLDPLELSPDVATGALSTAMMRGERRAVALNVRSSGAPRALTVRVDLPALPGAAVQINRVNWTGNDHSDWAAAEIELLGDASAARETTILPGVTQQIWIQLTPGRSAAAGLFMGTVSLSVDAQSPIEIPVSVRVFNAQFPEHPAMHFGGWDYSDEPSEVYAVKADNRAAFVAHLQERHVDTPWAHSGVMHWNSIDTDGNALAQFDTTLLERWLSEWPTAGRFRVDLGVGSDIVGIPLTDPRFAGAVAAWARSWAAQIRRLDRSPEEFDLLLVDEPQTAEQVQATELWARAIRDSGAGFHIWTDLLYPQPARIPQSLIDASDTLAVYLGVGEQAGNDYWDWTRNLCLHGKTAEIYAFDGPARRLDPYTYYRLTPWRAFLAGAAGVTFWSFADTRGTPADHEFAASDVNYSPLFLGDRTVRAGKQMEAAVEGIQDAEYLRLLALAGSTHPSETARLRANELLNAVTEFVSGAARSSNAQWLLQRDNSKAEELRVKIGDFLDSLGSCAAAEC
jgi:hypothetical protein